MGKFSEKAQGKLSEKSTGEQNPIVTKNIFVASDYPTLVEANANLSTKYIMADTATDNDPTKTNTNETHTKGKAMHWNGVDGYTETDETFFLDTGTALKSINQRQLDMQNKKITNLADPDSDTDGTNKRYVDNRLAGSSFDYFLSDTAEGVIVNYNLMYSQDTNEPESTIVVPIPAADTLIKSFITEVTEPDFNILIAGLYETHIHMAKSAGTKNVTVYMEFYKRDSGGTETLLATTEVSPNLTVANIAYSLHASLAADENLANDDRIAVKYYGTPNGAGTDPTVTLYLEGTNGSRVEIKTTTDAFQGKEGMTFSGQVEGGDPSINVDPTKFNLTEGYGFLIDNSDPINPVRRKVEWTATVGETTPFLNSDAGTFLGKDVDGNTVTQVTDFTPTQLANQIIRLGRLGHFGRTVITGRFYYPWRYLSCDLDWAIDIIKKGTVNIEGNEFSANGANLRLNKTPGLSHRIGANYETDKNRPNTPESPGEDQIGFLRASRSGSDSTILNYTVDITSLTRSGTTVTANTAADHKLSTDMNITISGVDQSEYNGQFEITSIVDSDTFTYEIVGTPVTPATGTITGVYGLTKDIDPTQWDDDSGTLQSVGVNDFTILEMIFFPNNSIYTNMLIYGQTVYSTFAQGKTALADYSAEIESDIAGASLRTLILIRGGATNLESELAGNDAVIRNLTNGGSVGGAGTTTYDGLTDTPPVKTTPFAVPRNNAGLTAIEESPLLVSDTNMSFPGILTLAKLNPTDGLAIQLQTPDPGSAAGWGTDTYHKVVHRVGGTGGMAVFSGTNILMMLDSDNTETLDFFQIRKDGTSFTSGTLLFEVAESGLVTIPERLVASKLDPTSGLAIELQEPSGSNETGWGVETFNKAVRRAGASGGMGIYSSHNIWMMLDSNNIGSGAKYQIRTNSNSFAAGTLLFEVTDTGDATINRTLTVDGTGLASGFAGIFTGIESNGVTNGVLKLDSGSAIMVVGGNEIDSDDTLSINFNTSSNLNLCGGGGHVEVADIRGISGGNIVFKTSGGSSILSILNGNDVITSFFMSFHEHATVPVPSNEYSSIYVDSATGDLKWTGQHGGSTKTYILQPF